jgi:hypothetical protein
MNNSTLAEGKNHQFRPVPHNHENGEGTLDLQVGAVTRLSFPWRSHSKRNPAGPKTSLIRGSSVALLRQHHDAQLSPPPFPPENKLLHLTFPCSTSLHSFPICNHPPSSSVVVKNPIPNSATQKSFTACTPRGNCRNLVGKCCFVARRDQVPRFCSRNEGYTDEFCDID